MHPIKQTTTTKSPKSSYNIEIVLKIYFAIELLVCRPTKHALEGKIKDVYIWFMLPL